MNRPIAIVLIVVAIGGSIVLGFPVEKSDTTQTIAKKYEENKKIEVVQEASQQVIKQVENQAIDSNCKNPNSSFCSTTTFAVSIIGIAFALLIIAGIVAGIVAIVKTISSILSNF